MSSEDGGIPTTTPRQSGIQSAVASLRKAVVPGIVAVWTALASIWTYFTWYYQEVIIPSSAPVNLTTDVTLEEAGSGGGNPQPKEGLEAIRLSISATNVGTRNVYFLPNYWVATGITITSQESADDAWLQDANNRSPFFGDLGRHYQMVNKGVVAWSNVFSETYFLYPKETVSRSFVFYIPKGRYDMIDLAVIIPSTAKKNSARFSFKVDKDGAVNGELCIIERDSCRKVADGENDRGARAIQSQQTESYRQLPLWKDDKEKTK